MNKILCTLALIFLSAQWAGAAQQTILGGAGILWGNEKVKINSNFTELYGQAFDADVTDLVDGSLTGTKVGFADTDNLFTATNIQAAVEELNDSINAGAPNGTGAKVHWSQLLGVPAGFADGTDSEGVGGGYTNLTSFVDQTAWRVFYSNTAGDVTELALGADGTYLKSNGATSAPTWATPSGLSSLPTADNQLLQATGVGTYAWTSTLDGIGNITGAGSYNNVTITQPATGATLTLVEGSTLATSGAYSITLTSTAATNVTLPTTGTLLSTAGIGSSVQAYDADLDDLADGSLTGSKVSAASDSVVGVSELATTAETTAGTSTSLTITPDGLSGSVYGQKEIGWFVTASDTATAVADGKQAAVVPASMNGMNLVDLTCSVHDLNSAASGDTTVVLRRVRGATAADMTSAGVTIAYTDYTASDETVDTSNDDLATGDKLYIDVNAITTAAQKGLSCTALFQTP